MAHITGLVVISFTVGLANSLSAQSIDMGARAFALANAPVATSRFPFESVNPAAREPAGDLRVSFLFGQAHTLSELRYTSVAVAAPIRSVQAGGTLEAFGFDAYKRTTASLALAVPVLASAAIGVRLTARHVGFHGYGATTVTGISAGWVANVGSDVMAGGSWRYVGSNLRRAERMLPQELSFGFEARASPEVRIFGAAAHESGSGVDLRAAVEIDVTRAVAVRVGTGSSPDRVSLGFGLAVEPVSLGVAVSVHPILGPSFAFSASLE